MRSTRRTRRVAAVLVAVLVGLGLPPHPPTAASTLVHAAAGVGTVRVLHGWPDADRLTVTVAGEVTEAAFGGVSQPIVVPTGSHEVVIVGAGGHRVAATVVDVTPGAELSVLVRPGDRASHAVVAVVDDHVDAARRGHAHLRHVIAAPDLFDASVTAGGVELAPASVVRGVGSYVQVPAGPVTVEVRPPGQQGVALTVDGTLAAGSAYTVFVAGAGERVGRATLVLDAVGVASPPVGHVPSDWGDATSTLGDPEPRTSPPATRADSAIAEPWQPVAIAVLLATGLVSGCWARRAARRCSRGVPLVTTMIVAAVIGVVGCGGSSGDGTSAPSPPSGSGASQAAEGPGGETGEDDDGPASGSEQNAEPGPGGAEDPRPPAESPVSAGSAVWLPSVGTGGPLIEVGTRPDGMVEVPSDKLLVGWWSGSAVPGEAGPALLVGHQNRSGAFGGLERLGPGDEVEISRDGVVTSRYVVTAVETVDKDVFPTARVYAPTAVASLILVTCAGTWDGAHFSDNFIAWATRLE